MRDYADFHCRDIPLLQDAGFKSYIAKIVDPWCLLCIGCVLDEEMIVGMPCCRDNCHSS